ncbi:MAG: TonB-dependent receptor [Halioglobus sp.]|nr:TonB-dependent receptor [Halioglobus sp.]
MFKKKLSAALSSAVVLPAALGGLASVTGASSALAATSLALEEVVVTARKRSESLQQVPMAITAFTAADIDSAGLRDIEDVANLTPGFNLAPLFGGDTATPVIRGLSTTIGEPNVGFFIDGVYNGSRLTMTRLLGPFVERIEVAKGPQSALYGRNTFGGAVNFVTRRPGQVFEGEVEASYGSDGKQAVRATVGGPLGSSRFGYRLGALYDQFDGFYDNELTGDDLDDRETTAAMGTLSWSGDHLSADLNLMYNEVDNGDLALRYVANNAYFGSAFGAPPGYQMYVGTLPDFDDGYAVTPGGLERDQVFSSLRVDWELGPTTLTAITGYNDFSHERRSDDDYTAADIHYITTDNDVTEFSQELRLTSNTQGPLQWMLGLYYYDLDDDNDIHSAYSQPFASIPVPRFNGLNAISKQTTEDLALFGSLDWAITDTLTLGVSGRYGEEKKDVNAVDINLATGASGTFRDDDAWSSFQPRVTLNWQFSADHMAYASYAYAEKSGGFNVVTATGAVLPNERRYDPEESDNYEIGLKSEFADGRILTSLAAYYTRWDDQIVRAIGATGAVLNSNAGQTTSSGAEFELQARLTQRLDLTLGAAYNDAQYDDYFFAILAPLGMNPVLDGNTLQYAPQWTLNGSLAYNRPVAGGWDWFGRLDASYTDEQHAVQTNDAIIDSFTLVNLRTGLRNEDWALTLWVYNLADEKYNASAVFTTDPASLANAVTGGPGFSAFQALTTAGDPQSYGVTARYHF